MSLLNILPALEPPAEGLWAKNPVLAVAAFCCLALIALLLCTPLATEPSLLSVVYFLPFHVNVSTPALLASLKALPNEDKGFLAVEAGAVALCEEAFVFLFTVEEFPAHPLRPA